MYHVLRFLLDSPPFELASYKYHDSSLLHAPVPVELLPCGKEYKTQQFVLHTVHIEEVSYEGNDKVMSEFQTQMGFGSREQQEKTGKE